MAARSTSDTTLHDVAVVGDDAAMTLTDKSTWRIRVGFVFSPEEMARERLCFGDDKKDSCFRSRRTARGTWPS